MTTDMNKIQKKTVNYIYTTSKQSHLLINRRIGRILMRKLFLSVDLLSEFGQSGWLKQTE